MSLVGADGQAYQFSSSGPEAPAGPSLAPISTSNSFQFEPTPPVGASAGGGLFSSQAIDISSSLSFAPSLPERPKDGAAAKPVQLDFSELEEHIAGFEEEKRQKLRDQIAAQQEQIRRETDGTAALPSQIGDSKLFHSVVLKQYGKLHQLDSAVGGKKAFQSRKVKARDARRAKKAEDKADQLEVRGGGAMRKQKNRNKAKGQY